MGIVNSKSKERGNFYVKEAKPAAGWLSLFLLNKSFCGMSQIIWSGRITLQQAVVEQVELWRQLGHMQHVCFLWKDLEKQVLQSWFCKGILRAKFVLEKHWDS